jgi:hypothetical protein
MKSGWYVRFTKLPASQNTAKAPNDRTKAEKRIEKFLKEFVHSVQDLILGRINRFFSSP